MADWRTLQQLVLRELGQDISSPPTKIADDVRIAICDSIRFNRSLILPFNRRIYSFNTTKEVYDYNLPKDFMGIIGKVYFTPQGTDSTARYPLTVTTVDEVEARRFHGIDEHTGLYTSPSIRKYAIDITGYRFLVSPYPSDGNDKIEFRMIFDPGTPTYKYDGSAWTFYEPYKDGFTAIGNTYTNLWFTEGRDLIKNRALYILWSNRHGGTEESSIKAQSSMTQWLENKNQLTRETNRKSGGTPGQITKYFP